MESMLYSFWPGGMEANPPKLSGFQMDYGPHSVNLRSNAVHNGLRKSPDHQVKAQFGKSVEPPKHAQPPQTCPTSFGPGSPRGPHRLGMFGQQFRAPPRVRLKPAHPPRGRGVPVGHTGWACLANNWSPWCGPRGLQTYRKRRKRRKRRLCKGSMCVLHSAGGNLQRDGWSHPP